VKAQPYVATSFAPQSLNKLNFRFFGPFTILEKIDPSAYKLQLADCHIHLFFSRITTEKGYLVINTSEMKTD
jgi:hypothetical protein